LESPPAASDAGCRPAPRAAAASASEISISIRWPSRTTIANLQTKQVNFLDVHGVPAEHAYEFVNGWLATSNTPLSAKTVYRFSNSAHAGLGDQLPAGVLRFYMRDKRGDPQFIGESQIDHTPMGSTLSLATGDAFDVKVQPTVEERTSLGYMHWQTNMKYVLTNALPKPVTVALLQSGLWGETHIKTETLKSTRRSASEAEWSVNNTCEWQRDGEGHLRFAILGAGVTSARLPWPRILLLLTGATLPLVATAADIVASAPTELSVTVLPCTCQRRGVAQSR